MSENTTEQTFVKGSWQETLSQSASLLDRSKKGRAKASSMLWDGAQKAIEEWDTANDASAETLSADVMTALGGTKRKGDASKIKTVALATAQKGLVLSQFPNLSKAYAEARRLTSTAATEKNEDDAAEKAIESIAAESPGSATTPENAAKILLSKGLDGAVVAILDALGATNEAAHRAFMRSVSTEIAARVQAAKPKPAPKKATTPKKGAKPATGGETVKAEIKDGASKAKPKPVSASKGDPNKKPLPKKAAPVKKAAVKPEFSGKETAAKKAAPVKRATPVVKRG